MAVQNKQSIAQRWNDYQPTKSILCGHVPPPPSSR